MSLSWFQSLRTRLILLICLSATPPLAVAVYNAIREQNRIQSEGLQSAHTLVQLASQYQGGLIEGTRDLLSSLTHSPLVRQGDWRGCSAYLSGVTRANNRYSNIGVADLDGNIVCSGIPLQQTINIKDRSYFRRAVETGEFAIGDYHVGRVTGVASIGMAIPLYDDAQRISAVIYVAIKLDTLHRSMEDIPLPAGGLLMMFDRNKKLLTHTGGQVADWVLSHATALSRLSARDGQPQSEIYRHPFGSSWIFSWSSVKGLPDQQAITIVIAAPLESLLAKSRHYYFVSLGLMFLSVLLILAIALFGTQAFLMRRIVALIEATKRIGRGDFSTRVREQVVSGELGELAGHIDDMALKIKTNLAREQEYRYLFERNPNPMWVFSRFNFHFLTVNDAAVQHYGYSREEFLQMSITDLLPPDELPRAAEFIQGQQQGRDASIWRHLKKSGLEITVEAYTYPIDFQGIPALIASIKDITGEIAARDALAARDEQIHSVLQSTSEAICGIDMQGRCIFANPSLAALLGYDSVDELIGRNMHALCHHSHADGTPIPQQSCQIYRALTQGKQSHSDQEVFWRKDGSAIPVEYWSHPMYHGSKVTGAVITFFDITERKAQQQALEFQAGHDSLTGLPNRRLLHARLKELIEASGARPFALMLIDLDRFKEVNDTLGHHAGDLLLMQIASRLDRDFSRPCHLYRLGGDEFALVAPGLAEETETKDFVAELISEIEQPFDIAGIRLQIGASVGISFYPQHGAEFGGLMRCADVAMYAAKSMGALMAIYDKASDANSAERLALMSDLHQAIEQDQLVLHFQPKISLRKQQLDGFEALIRWQHPTRGLVPPGAFIPALELTSLIRPFTYWVIDHALAQCRQWHDQGIMTRIAVNISTRNLLDLDLPGQILGLLEQHGLAADRLELEITESAIMADVTRSGEVLAQLHAHGLRISIDDFGTGYSSLGYLQKLPIHTLKIDQSFIRKMTEEEGAISIVNSVISLAHSLGIGVVAEGVEDERTMEILGDLGCEVVQGYFISKPMDAARLAEWFSESQWVSRA